MRSPRIKQAHHPVRLSGNRIRIGTVQYGVGAEIQDDDEGTIWHLIQLMDGTRSPEDIVGELLRIRPQLDEESVREGVNALIDAGFVEDAGAEVAGLTPEEQERYSRSANYFAWIDIRPRSSPYEIQERLKRARVTIAGLGGSGSAVAMGLTAVGIGSIHCVDFDRVELSNLNRQLLYTEDDIGCPKVERAIDRLRRMNSSVTITGQELCIQSVDDLVPLMKSRDLFILCADQPAGQTQHWANEAALRTGTPWLMSMYAGPMLVVGLFIPFQTPCYECFSYAYQQRKNARDGEEISLFSEHRPLNATVAPTASITGQLGALEAIAFLGDLRPQTVGRLFHQNFIIYDHCYYVEAPFRDDCPLCGPRSPYR